MEGIVLVDFFQGVRATIGYLFALVASVISRSLPCRWQA
jgi:hypothetical protein